MPLFLPWCFGIETSRESEACDALTVRRHSESICAPLAILVAEEKGWGAMVRAWEVSSGRSQSRRRTSRLSWLAVTLLAVTTFVAASLSTVSSFGQSPGGNDSPYGGGSPPGGGSPTGESSPPGNGSPPGGDTGTYGVPSYSGSGTDEDPFVTTIQWSATFKEVHEVWSNREDYDNTTLVCGLPDGESGVADLSGDVTYFYSLVNGDWMLVNMWGAEREIYDSINEGVVQGVNPPIGFLFQRKLRDRQISLFVTAGADLTPGQEKACETGASSVEHDTGEEFAPDGYKLAAWDHVVYSDPALLIGWIEAYSQFDEFLTKVIRTDSWIEYTDAGPQQREETHTFLR